jgi:4,5-DOPA dioxygenase extradiol
LRGEGVPIAGSGNIVHNLHTYAWGQHPRDPYDWAVRFEATAQEMMQAGEFASLINYEQLGRDAALSIPTPDHYLPLLYVLATGQQREKVCFPVEGAASSSWPHLVSKLPPRDE